MVKVDSRESLTDQEQSWLKARGEHGPLAAYLEREAFKARDPWLAVSACKYWRKADRPEAVLLLTDAVLNSPSRRLNGKVTAALFTTRGGALRDLKRLTDAEACANTAIESDGYSFYPYNLLGAVCYQAGRPQKGDEYFAIAEQLGSQLRNREAEIRSAMERAGTIEQKAVALYLLAKDPQRYSWARFYL